MDELTIVISILGPLVGVCVGAGLTYIVLGKLRTQERENRIRENTLDALIEFRGSLENIKQLIKLRRENPSLQNEILKGESGTRFGTEYQKASYDLLKCYFKVKPLKGPIIFGEFAKKMVEFGELAEKTDYFKLEGDESKRVQEHIDELINDITKIFKGLLWENSKKLNFNFTVSPKI